MNKEKPRQRPITNKREFGVLQAAWFILYGEVKQGIILKRETAEEAVEMYAKNPDGSPVYVIRTTVRLTVRYEENGFRSLREFDREELYPTREDLEREIVNTWNNDVKEVLTGINKANQNGQ